MKREQKNKFVADNKTKHIEAERNLKKLNEELEKRVSERTAELAKHNRDISMLSACNVALVHAQQEKKLLKDICRIIVKIGGYRMAWVGSAEQDLEKNVLPVAQTGFEEGYLEKANISWSEKTLRGQGPTGRAIRERKIQYGQYLSDDLALAPWRKEALKRGFASSIALPLEDKGASGDVFGALTIYAQDQDAFSNKETALLKELADDLAFGVSSLRLRQSHDRARRYLLTTNKLLRLSNRADSRSSYFDAVLEYVKKLTRSRHICIKIFDQNGYLPYDSYANPNHSSDQNLPVVGADGKRCVCIQAISSKTEGKSFYTGDCLGYISGRKRKEQNRYCIKCFRGGITAQSLLFRFMVKRILLEQYISQMTRKMRFRRS
ncbi:MAG: GAF domain-containing protein [Parcubacteria group bacterium]|jgi:hypothetical protein